MPPLSVHKFDCIISNCPESSLALPLECPTCISCKGPLFDGRPVVITGCRHRFHYNCHDSQSVDWQLADRKCSLCGAQGTSVIQWHDDRYGTAALRVKLALLEASREGNRAAVSSALVKNPSLAKGTIKSGVYETGQGLIHAAAAHGQSAIVNCILNRGGDVNLLDYQGHTALKFAVEGGHVELVGMLIDRGGAESLKIAFYMALYRADANMLRELVNRGLEINDLCVGHVIDDFEADECTLLSVVLLQLPEKVSDEAVFDTVEFLVSQGITPSMQDLCLAAARGRLEVVRFFMANGLVDVEGHGLPLYFAVFSGRIELVRDFLLCGSLPDRPCPLEGKSTIHCAVEKGLKGIVHLLIDAGAKVDPYVATDGTTTQSPLCAAVRAGHEEIVKTLIERGAGIDIVGRDRYTPLVWAILAKNSRLFDLLLESGADVNAHSGLAIKTAIVSGDHPALLRLIEKGANISGVLDTGEIPLALANRLKRTKAAKAIAAKMPSAHPNMRRSYLVFNSGSSLQQELEIKCLVQGFEEVEKDTNLLSAKPSHTHKKPRSRISGRPA